MSRRAIEIEANLPHLRRFAMALTRDGDMADDLVQDTVERALSRWLLRKPGVSLRPWLFTILRNLFISGHRRRARMRIDDSAQIEEIVAVSGSPEDRLQLQQVLAMLGQLPQDQRLVILLVSVEGFSYAETARIMDVPAGTVMSRLSRGRSRLREMVETPPEQKLRSVT
jgi:RNA polymerase sigma-70 factor, ECF subfamily